MQGRLIEEARREMLRQARNVLGSNPPGIVVFHVDADETWTARVSSPNRLGFCPFVRDPLVTTATPGTAWHQHARERVGGLLFRAIPYVSMESWLYLNDSALTALVAGGSILAQDYQSLQTLRGASTHFDDIADIKAVATGIHDQYNRQCAAGLSISRAKQSPSFDAMASRWRGSRQLRALLA
jgi:hypothetical protein